LACLNGRWRRGLRIDKTFAAAWIGLADSVAAMGQPVELVFTQTYRCLQTRHLDGNPGTDVLVDLCAWHTTQLSLELVSYHAWVAHS
jgi:hypothetical protein